MFRSGVMYGMLFDRTRGEQSSGGGGGDFGSGSGSKFNCAARVGSGRVG